MSDAETCIIITFKAICDAHSELLSGQADEQLTSTKIIEFLDLAAGAGTQIESVAERDSVRSMMNYWTAHLSRLRPVDHETAKGEPPALAAAPGVQRPTLAQFDPGQAPDLKEEDRPYVGLSAFEAEQADLFYGRNEAIAQLLDLVKSNGAVLVSGASGTGKSSLVRAGLIPTIRAGEGGSDWLVLSAVPGFDPLGNILAAFAPEGADAGWRDKSREAVESDPRQIVVIAEERRAGRPLLLLVDQFEEMFSLSSPADRDRAGHALAALAEVPGIHLVLTIREEYVERERSERTLEGLDFSSLAEFRVPPMTAAELREAVTAPAARAGLVFQEGVVERIIADVAAEPAALPLLQFALMQLWHRREGNRVTLKAYEEVGGPTAALSRAAEKAYETLRSPEAQANAKLIFQQLVKPSLVYEAVRDRVTRQQLETLLPGPSVRTVLDPFIAAALVRVSPGAERGEDRIEIAHEALIRNWERLRRWSLELRDKEEQYLSLAAKAEDWQRSGRAPGHLLFGKALADAEKVHSSYRGPSRGAPDQARLIEAYLAASRLQTRRVKQGLVLLAVILLALLLGGGKWLTSVKGQLADVVDSLESITLRQAKQARFNSDAPRQFVQMLLSRGTITTADLPAEYAEMLPQAAEWKPPARPLFEPDFLGRPNSDFWPEPPKRSKALRLPNLLLWLDPESGAPLLAISQSKRGPDAVGQVAPTERLFHLRGAPGQLSERDVALRGLGLARLVDWREVGWGDQARLAVEAANLLSTMFPSYLKRDHPGGLSDWSMLNNWLLLSHNPGADKVVYISGIVPNGGPGGRLLPPRYVWKVAVSADPNGKILVDAVMLSSGASAGSDGPGRTSLEEIARHSGLDFSKLIKVASTGATTTSDVAPATAARAEGMRVHIHTKEFESGALEVLQRSLKTARFNVMAPEEVAACVDNPLLRYFRPEDKDVAEHAATLAREALRGGGYPDLDVQAQPFMTASEARLGHLELWVCGLDVKLPFRRSAGAAA